MSNKKQNVQVATTKYDKGCRRTLGHGEFCVEGHLCSDCEDKRTRALLPKISTFNFNVGDEIVDANQIVNGLMHFGLIAFCPKQSSFSAQYDGVKYVVVTPFTIGWEEKDG